MYRYREKRCQEKKQQTYLSFYDSRKIVWKTGSQFLKSQFRRAREIASGMVQAHTGVVRRLCFRSGKRVCALQQEEHQPAHRIVPGMREHARAQRAAVACKEREHGAEQSDRDYASRSFV